MMIGSPKRKILWLLRTRTAIKRTIIVGLKSDNCSREMLLGLLTMVAKPGDNVLAVHVQEPNDTFDPNTFHLHEDLCKSKQVDLLVKVCAGDGFISPLTHLVRVHYATILALGCGISGPKDSVVNTSVKRLPPTCTLMVVDNGGRVLVQKQGTSQQGSTRAVLKTSHSSPIKHSSIDEPIIPRLQLHKSLTIPTSSTSSSSSSIRQADKIEQCSVKKTVQVPQFLTHKLFQRLALLEVEGTTRRFTSKELSCATMNFSLEMVIGEGGHSKVYRANLEDGRAAAVKVLKTTSFSAEDVLQEVEILSSIKHEHTVQIIGYCSSEEMHAIVYNLLKGSLKQHLIQLKWSERMGVAIGVAKALEYLHHSCNPPIIHRDVKSSNILLSDSWQPQLSDFGAAMVQNQSQQALANTEPVNVVGTFGYLAPEYMMFGKVDEKTDVYSYGVVLLELITGKEAIQANQANHESLVLWARSLLSSGLCEHVIDPYLKEEYNKDEMETMIFAARLCLIHSSSRRPTMKMILSLFEQPEYWLKKQREKDELLKGMSFRVNKESASNESIIMDDI